MFWRWGSHHDGIKIHSSIFRRQRGLPGLTFRICSLLYKYQSAISNDWISNSRCAIFWFSTENVQLIKYNDFFFVSSAYPKRIYFRSTQTIQNGKQSCGKILVFSKHPLFRNSWIQWSKCLIMTNTADVQYLNNFSRTAGWWGCTVQNSPYFTERKVVPSVPETVHSELSIYSDSRLFKIQNAGPSWNFIPNERFMSELCSIILAPHSCLNNCWNSPIWHYVHPI